MDEKQIIKWGLIALGVYLVYEYIQTNGGFAAVLGTSTTPTGTGTGTSIIAPAASCPPNQYMLAGKCVSDTNSTSPTAPPAPPPANQTPALGTPFYNSAGDAFTWNGAGWSLVACAAGRTNTNGVCAPAQNNTNLPPATNIPATPISQAMLALATAAGQPNNLNMDQWCYYYAQVTGTPCDLPPVSGQIYNGAGVVNEDGSMGDNTTPMPISSWLAIVQLVDPGLGLTGLGGLGAFSKPNPRWRPEWLN